MAFFFYRKIKFSNLIKYCKKEKEKKQKKKERNKKNLSLFIYI